VESLGWCGSSVARLRIEQFWPDADLDDQ